ncbi:MAG: porin [Gammaproteobacteria bacterium]|nr:porin [Gammaproteobacteria bacterium]NND38802.1 porin [Pseudomonadales bacterium]NNM11207.1 porin [Pseudomonadales bacterium]
MTRLFTLSLFLVLLTLPRSLLAMEAIDELSFYGRANLSLNRIDLEAGNGTQLQDNWELRSNTSVLGLRGSQVVQPGLRAVFQLEYEVFVDDGDDGNGGSSEFNQRNSYLGLEGKWGRLIAGKHDTPLKMVQGKIDRFNDLLLGDLRSVMQGENRPDNIVIYRSPVRDNWQWRAALIPGEDNGTSDPAHDDLSNAVSASFEYKRDDTRFAIAHERGETIDTDVDYITRAAFEHNESDFSLGAIVQLAELVGGGDEKSLLLSGEMPLQGRYFGKAQIALVDLSGGERTQLTMGVDYRFSKNAKAYGYVSRIAEDVGPDSQNLTAGVGFKLLFSKK